MKGGVILFRGSGPTRAATSSPIDPAQTSTTSRAGHPSPSSRSSTAMAR